MTQPTFEASGLRDEFARRNIERLSKFDPPEEPPKDDLLGQISCNPGFEILKLWSKEIEKSIDIAISQRVFGAKRPIDWNIASLPFMESCAVYLRDWGTLLEAWKLAREYELGERNDVATFESAISLYKDAYRGIGDLAKLWGLDFVPVCDLIHFTPDKRPEWDGPYCGAFFTTDAQEAQPFIGLSFKGTNPLNLKEVSVDYNYQLVQDPNYFDNAGVSQGVFTGLFGTFDAIGGSNAYNFILKQLGILAQTLPNTAKQPVLTHVTGHSLGGSYSSLEYAQLLVDIPNSSDPPLPFTMGDEYTFGAPRVGSNDWATFNYTYNNYRLGQSWRIVNDQDIVPQVPPTTLKPQTDFHHLDKGMKIFKDKPPVDILTERDQPDPEPYAIKSVKDFISAVIETGHHIPNSYMKAMVTAINSSP